MASWYKLNLLAFLHAYFGGICRYGLGWRGGKWYANRKFRKEQMKLLGQIKPKRWPTLKFLKRPLMRSRSTDCSIVKTSDSAQKDAPITRNSDQIRPAS